jgi:hypothetical protein
MAGQTGGITLTLLESDKVVRRRILKALSFEIMRTLNKSAGPIEKDIKKRVFSWIYDSPEMHGLRSGSLGIDIGLTRSQADQASTSIAQAVVDSTIVIVNIPKSPLAKIKGKITINVQPKNFSNIPITKHLVDWGVAGSVPWIDILLFRGDEIIVEEFDIEYGPFGRSGGGKMIDDAGDLSGWGIGISSFTRVPSSFSGTATDNFITRALQGKEAQIEQIVKKRIKEAV